MNFLKGLILTIVILVALIGINIVCNINGINLDATITGTSAAVFAMFAYAALTKEKKEENK